MRKRTKARQLALQILYQIDITHDSSSESLKDFCQRHTEGEDATVQQFTLELVEGIQKYREVIDKRISQYAKNWELKRMAVVDRNILRQACFELLYRPDIPPKVAINEAIELAKRFSDLESGKFVNGILDKIREDISRPRTVINPTGDIVQDDISHGVS
jgi:transcription antitermination factor NusB